MAEQAALLIAMGCDTLQRHYFGRPMFADDFKTRRAEPLDFGWLAASFPETGAKTTQ